MFLEFFFLFFHWNKLPHHVTSAPSTNSYKVRLAMKTKQLLYQKLESQNRNVNLANLNRVFHKFYKLTNL